MKFIHNAVLATSLVACSAAPLLAQQIPNEGPVPTTALINADVKNGTPLDPSMLKLEVNGHESTLTSVRQVSPASAQVAILIDDGLRQSFDLQLRDVQEFINELPAGTQVLVGYMQNGTVRSSGGFSKDRAAVSGELRIPMSSAGISASPYFCLSEFVKQWPSQEPAARFVLMITNGVDPYNGSVSPLNQDSPYVQSAQDDAQRAGVAVYSLYYSNRGIGGGTASFSGQSYLQQIADATGGRSLYQGNFNPVSFAPFLAEFRKDIAESYTISFMASASREKGDTLARLKLKTSQPGVKLHAPQGAHPGITEAQ